MSRDELVSPDYSWRVSSTRAQFYTTFWEISSRLDAGEVQPYDVGAGPLVPTTGGYTLIEGGETVLHIPWMLFTGPDDGGTVNFFQDPVSGQVELLKDGAVVCTTTESGCTIAGPGRYVLRTNAEQGVLPTSTSSGATWTVDVTEPREPGVRIAQPFVDWR